MRYELGMGLPAGNGAWSGLWDSVWAMAFRLGYGVACGQWRSDRVMGQRREFVFRAVAAGQIPKYLCFGLKPSGNYCL